MLEKLIDGQTVLRDLTEQDRRDVAAAVIGNGRGATVGMAELLVRAALADFYEPQSVEKRDDFARL